MTTTESRVTKPIVDPVAVRLLLTRYWKAIFICLVLGLIAGLVVTLTTPKTYTASASGVVVVRGSNDLGGVLSADMIAKSKAKQFQSLAKSRTVAAEALRLAKVSGNPDAAAGAVTVGVPEDTAQINLTVSHGSAQTAAKLANAWVTALSKSVANLTEGQIASGGGNNGGATTTQSVVSVQPYVVAPVPGAPSSPKLKINLLLGAILGLLAGLAWAIFRAQSDRRIRNSEVIEKNFGLSVVGTLPLRADSSKRAFLLDKIGKNVGKRDFRSVESFNELRANLQFMHPDSPLSAIVVTSPLATEGKSTVAANLAISIAESGRSVVLVDGDLRRPAVADTFGVVPDVGVTTAVVNQVPVEECLQQVHGVDRLQLLAAGPIPPNPSEILGSAAFASVIGQLSAENLVVIDTPPSIPVADAAIVTRRVDGCLMVVDTTQATQDSLRKAISVMDKVDAEVLGVVLNRVPTGRLESSQYGYYGDEYSYSADGNRHRHAGDAPLHSSAGAAPADVSETRSAASTSRRRARQLRG